MSNHITIELCTEDRARFDGLGVLLSELIDRLPPRVNITQSDDLQKKLAEAVAKAKQATATEEAAETPTEPSKEEALTDVPPTEENPTEEEPTVEQPAVEEPTVEESTQKVTHEMLLAKVIELSAKDVNLKAKARDIVLGYAPRVKAVPEEKLNECYDKLVALEG